ncbi:S9 family peptidase [Lacinutrix sp. Hel_I_90]|uniref:alpha/beta hydrolase family protein n=1 Tax=Lacinutrix sp. Hel_I_90 TaxID=1249999 RepID=UPI0005C88B73|nr:prolyl oligopeptidase family serine peptidase [Lacinutrix sp. Hel_I_90]
MKNQVIVFLISILTFSTGLAQDSNLLIKKKLISNFSETPIYSRLTENIGGAVQWKEQLKYIDSIEVYSITYLSDGLKVNGLLVKPKKEGNYPCVIYNRGGNRDFGALKIAHGILTLGQIAKEGYVVIASQYRGNGGSEGQEEFGGKDVNDVVILTEVLKEIDGADTNNIGMYGWSRGGMMTYIALTKTNKIKAAVVGGGLSDLTVIDRPKMESGVYAELIPNYKENKIVELEKRSAIKWVDQFPKNTPILVLHGNADWRVKSTNSLKLAFEFEKYRIPYRLTIFDGGDHGITEYKEEVNEDVISWFDRFLKADAVLPNMEYHGK